jgi:hypothetical protein
VRIRGSGAARIYDAAGAGAADPEADCAAALDRLLDYYLRSAVVAGRYLARHTPPTAPGAYDTPTSIPPLPAGAPKIWALPGRSRR